MHSTNKICSVRHYIEEPLAHRFVEDVEYYLEDSNGYNFASIFYLLKACREGPQIYFIDENGHAGVISEDDLEKFGDCFISCESEESSLIRRTLKEFSEDFRVDELKMVKEIIRLRKELEDVKTP